MMREQELREIRQERSTYERNRKAVTCGFCRKIVVALFTSDPEVVGSIGPHTSVERDGKVVGVCWGVLQETIERPND